MVVSLTEKSQTAEGWLNGGYPLFEPAIFDYRSGDDPGVSPPLTTFRPGDPDEFL